MELIKLDKLIELMDVYSSIINEILINETIVDDKKINIEDSLNSINDPYTRELIDYCLSIRLKVLANHDVESIRHLMSGNFLNKMVVIMYLTDGYSISDITEYIPIIMQYKQDTLLCKLLNGHSTMTLIHNDYQIQKAYDDVFKTELRDDKLNKVLGK